MDTEPLEDVTKHCMKCNCVKRYEEGIYSLGRLRRACANCRLSGTRIYKADAIITALRLKKESRKPYRGGRKSKIPENVRKAMREQHDNGISIRQIATNTGYNKNTVTKVLKEFKE